MEESKRTLFFNAPGFRNQEVEVAPDIEPMKSKRKPLIDQEVRPFALRLLLSFQ